MKRQDGYTFIILMAMIAILAIGLLAAVPVWQTQIRREAEDELIFRGRQYVEAVRLFNRKNPGRFPATVDDLVEARCLRRPFPDPMTKDGEWDLVLAADGGAAGGPARPAAASRSGAGAQAVSVTRVFVVPQGSLSSVDNPRLLGVVSRSPRSSLRLYRGQDTYDAWLFFYGQSGDANPEIIRFDRADK